ncbi:MAG: cobalt-precorrin-6A reductase [Alphaproteobacteria bacterium]
MAECCLLILGGTGEAAALAARAALVPHLRVITSLAGRTSAPLAPHGELRRGGFGGADGLAAYLQDAAIDLVVDASHPFAAAISRHAEEACARAGKPRLVLVRPPWRRQSGDRWIEVDDLAGAAAALPGLARRVFLSVGRQELRTFAAVRDCWFLVRLIEPLSTALPLAEAEIITARGPFTVEGERQLMTSRRIEALVSKNSGGDATYAKIAAARELGLPVVMVRRPAPPPGETVEAVEAALEWIVGHLS